MKKKTIVAIFDMYMYISNKFHDEFICCVSY